MTSFSPIRYFDRQTQNLKDKQTEMRSLTDMLAMKRKEKKRKENRRDAYLRGEEEAKRNRNWRWGGREVAAFVSWKRRRKEGGRLGCLLAGLLALCLGLFVGWLDGKMAFLLYLYRQQLGQKEWSVVHPSTFQYQWESLFYVFVFS